MGLLFLEFSSFSSIIFVLDKHVLHNQPRFYFIEIPVVLCSYLVVEMFLNPFGDMRSYANNMRGDTITSKSPVTALQQV